MALARPPAPPGGGVLAVNTSSDRPEKPFHSSVARIEEQPHGAEDRGGDRQGHDDGAAPATAVVAGHGLHVPRLLSIRINISRAAARTMKVMTKRMSAMAISDEV